MAVSKNIADKALTVIAAAAAPALTLCVDTGAISAAVATDVGGIVAAVVAAWHAGSVATARLSTPTVAEPK